MEQFGKTVQILKYVDLGLFNSLKMEEVDDVSNSLLWSSIIRAELDLDFSVRYSNSYPKTRLHLVFPPRVH